MKKLVAIVLTVAVLLSITACGGKTDKTSGKNSKELNIYMWQSYISDDLIKNFAKERLQHIILVRDYLDKPSSSYAKAIYCSSGNVFSI